MKAYSTADPVIVGVFLASQAAAAAFTRRLIDDALAIGRNSGPLRSRWQTFGLAVDDRNHPPQGWTYSKAKRRLIPRRGQDGAQARAWLNDHQPTTAQDTRALMRGHGLPCSDLMGPAHPRRRRTRMPTLFHHDGTLWAAYQGTPGHWASGPAEPTWTPRPLAEYHAAREAHDVKEAQNA